MSRRSTLLRGSLALAAALAGVSAAATIRATQPAPPLTVHEWGTFTTIAGPDGQAMQWLPLGGPTDLPCFVEYYKNRLFKVMPPSDIGPLLDYEKARTGLKGTVRMETPVLYFYAPGAVTASVSVSFPQGLFTEFYPRAEILQAPSYANILAMEPNRISKITWPSVSVMPGATPELPTDRTKSHYYAARETDSAPIRSGSQDEKFLFYRGVAGFPVPVSAALEADGSVRLRNLSQDPLPRVFILTRHGGKFGFRAHGAVAAGSEVVLRPPPLDESGRSLAALRQDLERTLVAEGLFEKEARAMVETWRDDWFNDGTRVFYVVPAADIDAILPLQVSPAPSSVVRAFVGRMEVITPRSEADVERAIAQNDARLIEAYGRWLGPIGERILARTSAPEAKAALVTRLDGIFKHYLTRVTACD